MDFRGRLFPALCVCGIGLAGPRPAAGQPLAPLTPAQERLACAPSALPEPPIPTVQVATGFVRGQYLFGPGDRLVIDAGTAQGLQPGQSYYVRRQVRDQFTPETPTFKPISIHTAGFVTIVDAKEHSAVATVTHTCDGVLAGDYLEPYTSPTVPEPAAVTGKPDFEHPAQIVMADERRQTGSAGSFMLVDRGSDQGLRAGQTVTIFRPAAGGLASIEVGHATIMSVRPQTALIRIDDSHDAVYLGDFAAVHRIQ